MTSTIKKLHQGWTTIVLLVILLAACKKDGVQLQLQPGAFPANALNASTTTVSLSASTINDTAIIFTWPAVTYNQAVPVSYTIQLDKISDTSGATAWANAKTFTTTNLRQALLGTDLNNFAASAGFTPGVAAPVAFRVLSNVTQQNGSNSRVPASPSNTIVVTLTPPPFPPYLFVPGAYQGWDPGSASTIVELVGRPGLYEGYENITGSGVQYFKYTDNPDWNHTNYGDGGNGTFSTDGLAGGLNVPDGGYYELTANLLTNTWTATRTTWGIIGDATPGGWSNDTQMTYDLATQTWKVTANMVKAGSFKFRANNQWSIDFGVDNTGKLMYADNPFYGYNGSLNNLTVPVDGNYTIILDLHISGNYTYQLIKN